MAAAPAASIPRAEIVHMLSALGEAKANDVVLKTARELGLPTEMFDGRQALQILEAIARQPGLVGITARFAKARAILRWKTAA